jgi:hypothetical protein
MGNPFRCAIATTSVAAALPPRFGRRRLGGELSFDDDRYQSAAIMTIGFKPVKGG